MVGRPAPTAAWSGVRPGQRHGRRVSLDVPSRRRRSRHRRQAGIAEKLALLVKIYVCDAVVGTAANFDVPTGIVGEPAAFPIYGYAVDDYTDPGSVYD